MAGPSGRCRGLPRLAALAMVFAAVSAPAAAETVAEPPDFRMEEYRAPVPATLAGATVIDTAAAEALWRAGTAVFVDALPRPVRPADLPAGTVWHDKPRPSIPGAAWLANVGYGRLAPEMEDYFRRSLEELTAGDHGRRLVFFCLADCWMSWNAARRAVSWGYTAVDWYPAGTDGWAAAGLPLENATPRP
jgi:PQQ-dependent catabolism-associated CXXCW motif protein